MFFFVSSDFSGDSHSLRQCFDEGHVDFIDLFSEFCEVFSRLACFADDEVVDDQAEHVRGHLLRSVAPCVFWVVMRLYDETIKLEVHRLLAKRCDEVSSSCYMTWVADDRKFRMSAV